MYDARLGRWFGLDPLSRKYPHLSPYNFTGNNPILYVDYDGKDFGIKIDHDAKTIIIVANIYTTSKTTYNQAMNAANLWNAATATVDGYKVSFEISVKEPSKGLGGEELLKKYPMARVNAAYDDASVDPIGNAYYGTDHKNSGDVGYGSFTGGATILPNQVYSNFHFKEGDLGWKDDMLAHEFGHLFGLDDEVNKETKKPNPFYSGDGGIMEYKSAKNNATLKLERMNPINFMDIKTILDYAKMAIQNPTQNKTVNVSVIEEKGATNENSPLGK